MKKQLRVLALVMAVMMAFSACGKDEVASISEVSISETPIEDLIPQVSESVSEEPEVEVVEEPEVEVVPEGMYRSELTNEIISEDVKDQRPIAGMVDTETKAYPHMGLNQADVVYELMNSTANGRITRLMCLVKDWKNLEQFGSIRSTRPTNVLLAGEWNAILVHDGGPYYINEYLAREWSNNLSGGFARYTNGKNWEYTEYVTSESFYNADQDKTYAGLISRVEKAGYTETYNDYYEGPHFTFNDKDADYTADHASGFECKEIDLPYPHNSSKLIYNEETQTYDYYCYGDAHVDPLDGNKVMSFKNLIVYAVDFYQYDEHGYLIYNCIGAGDKGYFISNGFAIPIHWAKPSENGQTLYYDLEKGGLITLNTGKTYITMVPADVWDEVEYK